MTHRYHITLNSPMGPREGELTLTGEVNGAVTGILSVLDFVSLLELTGETITGVTHTGKGSIHWTGVRQPD